MAKPHGANPGRAEKHALLTQLVGYPNLPGGGITDGKGQNRLLNRIVHAVLEIRSAPILVQ